jgi:hypothetical protein
MLRLPLEYKNKKALSAKTLEGRICKSLSICSVSICINALRPPACRQAGAGLVTATRLRLALKQPSPPYHLA